ncbi:MAG TPA: hypothetical protein VFJ75_08585 [Gaiellaceae bacterium]|nr:hypothetical protein [Gaiellaceae bacterium]
MKRELTWGEVVLLPTAFAASAAGLACSLLLLFEGRDWTSVAFGLGGVALAFWTGARAVSAPPRRR